MQRGINEYVQINATASSRHVTPAVPSVPGGLWGARFLRPKSHERAVLRVTGPPGHSVGRPWLSHPRSLSPSHAHHTPPCGGRAGGCRLLSTPAGPGLDHQAQAQHRHWLLFVRRPELSSARRLSGMVSAQHPETRRGSAIPRQLPEAGQSTCAHSQPCPRPGPAFTHPQAPEARGLYPSQPPVPSPRRH